MWGTHDTGLMILGTERFIPTHVGNTALRRRYMSSPPVHPHACGEHYKSILLKKLGFGSSPRMWGTLNAS